MKRIFILTQVVAIHLAVVSQSNYNLKFEENVFSFLETEMGYQILPKSTDYYLLGDTTLPALPYKNIRILIPENTDVENINISIKSREIHQSIYLISNPAEKQVSTFTNNSNSNAGNYSGKIYPDKNLKFETVLKSQGFYMAAFSVCPFIYDAQKRSLELITEMNISFNQSKRTNIESTNLGVRRYDIKEFVRSLVINPEELNVLYPQQEVSATRRTTNDIEYLIITSENLKENFNPLKAWKIRKGVKAEILSTSYIYTNYPGATNQIKIKKCLQDYSENKNLKWILLGGDDAIVPVQMCYVQTGTPPNTVSDYTPCDLFYACFDNNFNWDANNNGIIGETDDDIDMEPEIYISRAPIRTAEDINAFVNKTLEYETNPPTSNYVKTMLLTGAKMYSLNGVGESDAHWKSEEMYSNYITPYWANAVKTKFYDTGTDFPGGASYNLTATNLQTVLNNGYHFVHMATHGATTTWVMEAGGYSAKNAQNQTNSKQSIIVTIACYTNAFDNRANDPCLSEAFIRNPNGGGLLYWGSSRTGWSGASWSFSRRFFRNFFSGELDYKFGAVTAVTKSYYISPSYDTARWLQFSQNSIGDPELSIYTENPSKFTSATVSPSGTTVTVNTGGISDCTIALTSMDFGTTFFEVKNNVSSATFTNVNCPYYVTITKHNYIPYQYPEDVYIQDFTFNNDAYIVGRNICLGNNVQPSLSQGDVIIKNGVNVIFDAKQNVKFDNGFKAELGGTFKVQK